jgi:hypothetical protein
MERLKQWEVAEIEGCTQILFVKKVISDHEIKETKSLE